MRMNPTHIMGWNQELLDTHKSKICSGGAAMREGSRILITTCLSLLLPLSFLLTARMPAAVNLSSTAGSLHLTRTPFPSSVFIMTTAAGAITLIVILIISVAAFTHQLLGKKAEFMIVRHHHRLHFHGVWVLLFLIQVCTYLGIQGSELEAKITNVVNGREVFLVQRVMLALGLHETMVFWWKSIVRPLVDDTLFGDDDGRGHDKLQEEKYKAWIQKAAMAVAFCDLWWRRRLWEEAELLVLLPSSVAEEQPMDFWVAERFIRWWLYYLTVATGLFSVTKWFLCTVRLINVKFRSKTRKAHESDAVE